MARSNRGRVRRSTKSGPKNQSWISLVFDGVVVDDAPVMQFDLVEGPDWNQGTGLERATLMRIRGWLVLLPPAGVPSTIFATVSTQDEDIGVGGSDPTDPNSYRDEDIFWTFGRGVAATVANDLYVVPVDFDVKSMRKINSGQDVRLTMVTNGPVAAGWTLNGVIRSLVRISE